MATVGASTTDGTEEPTSSRESDLRMVGRGVDGPCVFEESGSGEFCSNGHASYAGTRASTPQVAALAAYLWNLEPERTPEQIEIILDNAYTLANTPGVIDAYLNGDAFVGGESRVRGDLDGNAIGLTAVTVTTTSGDIELDENAVTDVEVLCYYAHSSLYVGDTDLRDALIGICATPPTDATVTTQAQLDAFAGILTARNVTIGPTSGASDITNLDALSQITSVRALLIQSTPALTSLAPLANHSAVENIVSVTDCDLLEDLDGLQGLMDIEGDVRVERCSQLQSLAGLSGLSGLMSGGLSFASNENLATLQGLGPVTTTIGHVQISSCPALTNLGSRASGWTPATSRRSSPASPSAGPSRSLRAARRGRCRRRCPSARQVQRGRATRDDRGEHRGQLAGGRRSQRDSLPAIMSGVSPYRRRGVRAWLRPMVQRDPGEPHRTATPLELFFDLCFVVAIANVASHLHHGLAEGQFVHAARAYGMVFIAIWWAWMGLTWFATTYDNDDPLYRTKVFVQMVGVLVLAAGVPRAFDHGDFSIITLGYCIMRVALVSLWVRAAREDPPGRRTALRYAIGIAILQLGWIGLLFVPASVWTAGWAVLILLELSVPAWATLARPTTWHRHHIAERYGLLTIIVLGESVLAATVAIQSAIDDGTVSIALLRAIGGGLLILFSMWWIYFADSAHGLLTSVRVAFQWGYGHLFVFASAAAVGAGLSVYADVVTHHAHVSGRDAAATIAVPAAVFLFMVWLLHVRPAGGGSRRTAYFAGATVLTLLAPWSPWPVLTIGIVMTALVTLSMRRSTTAGVP